MTGNGVGQRGGGGGIKAQEGVRQDRLGCLGIAEVGQCGGGGVKGLKGVGTARSPLRQSDLAGDARIWPSRAPHKAAWPDPIVIGHFW